jgi:hypothetical protein
MCSEENVDSKTRLELNFEKIPKVDFGNGSFTLAIFVSETVSDSDT